MSRFMAGIYDWFMRDAEQACLQEWRHELLAGLSGEVIDVGAGTGANVIHYPSAVTGVMLAEPDPFMRAKLVPRVTSRCAVIDAPVERLPFDAGRFDAVVCTLVLCSVADQGVALREMHRVLRPGGRLVFLEHVASRERGRYLLQRGLDPLWQRIAGNCHLTRDTGAAIRAAGFVVEEERHESMRKAMPQVRPSIRGTAVVT